MNSRTKVGLAVVAFWLLMTALLLQREWGGTKIVAGADSREETNEASSTWLGLYMTDGPQVGHIHLRRLPEQRHGLAGTRFTTMWDRIPHHRGPGMTLQMCADSLAEASSLVAAARGSSSKTFTSARTRLAESSRRRRPSFAIASWS